MLARQSGVTRNLATSSSSRLLLAVYLLCWLPSVLEAFDENIPTVTITNASQEILILENSNVILQFTCNGSVESSTSLMWKRDGNFMFELSSNEPGISLTNETIANETLTSDFALLILTINVSEANTATLASTDGISYYCLAHNKLGVARSESVTLRYPSFPGFNESMANETVPVKLGQAVGLHCGILGSPVPDAEVTWLKDQEPISISPPHYRILDKGELVIYDLMMSDVLNDKSQPAQYRCRVDNVRMVENETAPFFYTLDENNVLPEDPTVYIKPPTSVFFTEDIKPSPVYLIYASNRSDADLVATSEFSSLFSEDEANLRIVFGDGITDSFMLTLFPGYLNDGAPTPYNSVRLEINVTKIEPLVIDPSTTMNEIFREFTNETTLTFNCIASGTGLVLVWYKDGEQNPREGPSWTIPFANPNDSGVYQCFWANESRPSQIFGSVSWALVVRDREQPSVISLIPSVSPNDNGRVIVTEGTLVTISVTVHSNEFPKISWMFMSRNNDSPELLNTSDTSLYQTTNITLLGAEVYQFNLTLNMTAEISGFYSPQISDGFTDPFTNETIFISVEFPAEVLSVSSSHTCLVVGEVVSITCNVDGLPQPSIGFIKNSQSFDVNLCEFCNISDKVLTFSMTTPDDAGTYGCTADNGVMESDTQNLNNGDRFLYCDHPEASVVGSSSVTASEGDEVTLTCRVTSIPQAMVTWLFDGRNVDINSSSFTTTQTPDGDYSLVIDHATTANTGTYTCQANNTAIQEIAAEDIELTVNSQALLPVYAYAVIGVGAVLFIAVLISLILLCWCCYYSRKSGTYSASGTKRMLSKDEYDGRGNVDRDSDEEDGKGEEPEAFQPQYESLPALRPAAPPQYKPSPAYGAQADMEMVKMPIPDTESTAFEFSPGPPAFQGSYLGRPGNGNVVEDGHGGSAVGLQARFEDFMSDDGQFV